MVYSANRVTVVGDDVLVGTALVHDAAVPKASVATFSVPIKEVLMMSLILDEKVTGFSSPLS